MSMPIDQLRAPAFWMLSILTACPLTAGRPWTVEAILNIPSLGDPQIRPDGRYYAYVQRGLAGAAWWSVVHMAPIGSGAARKVATGARPRWSPDSLRLASLDGHVHVLDLKRSGDRVV